MGNFILVSGAQWGDEGKGKISDFLSQTATLCLRFNGGDNAGHSIKIKDQTFHLSLIPAGIFNPKTQCLIGAGCVVNLTRLRQEIDKLSQAGINLDHLLIDVRAHLLLPYHLLFDQLEEQSKGELAIGTTKRGIGPCYQDKVARIGFRIGDLLDQKQFKNRLQKVVTYKNQLLSKIYNHQTLDWQLIYNQVMADFKVIKPYLTAGNELLIKTLNTPKTTVVAESAQGMMLDLDHGTYPYVTSSNTTPTAALVSVGCGPQYVTTVFGVVKAYTTRVGNGQLPTEITSDLAHIIRERGHEYGVVSGRPRRIGWLDLVQLQYAVNLAGYTALAITLIDVLSGIDTIKVCNRYESTDPDAKLLIAAGLYDQLKTIKPHYQEFPGWTEDLSLVRNFESLPSQAQAYLHYIVKTLKVPIKIISVGPGRTQTFMVDESIWKADLNHD